MHVLYYRYIAESVMMEDVLVLKIIFDIFISWSIQVLIHHILDYVSTSACLKHVL